MCSMFSITKKFNQPLDSWNTKLTNMGRMFDDAESFNQPLDNWDVSNVEDMDSMFECTKSFNQDINKNWDINKVKNMRYKIYFNGFF